VRASLIVVVSIALLVSLAIYGTSRRALSTDWAANAGSRCWADHVVLG
jgi:hypothetical protein